MVLTGEFGLQMVQVLTIVIDAVADLVLALGPVHVEHVLELGVAAFVGHEGILHAKGVEACNLEPGPAAFEATLPVGAGDLQDVEADVLVQAVLFHFGSVGGVAEVGIQNQGRRKDVGGRDGAGVRLACGHAGVATSGGDARTAEGSEHAGVVHRVVEEGVATISGPLFVDVVVELGINRLAIKKEAADRKEVVVAEGGVVDGGHLGLNQVDDG